MANSAAENDLPLLSNVNDMLVKHYLFDFSCNFEKRSLKCCVALFLEPVINEGEPNSCECNPCNAKDNNFISPPESSSARNTFLLILDCYKVLVNDVEEINIPFWNQEKLKYKNCNPSLFSSMGKLFFSTEKWSLKIWKDVNTCKLCFPKLIRITYETVPESPSLLWVTDQDKK